LTETYSACCRGSRMYCNKDKDVSQFNKALSQTLDTIRSNAAWIDVRGIRKWFRSALNLAFVAFYTRFIGMVGEVAKQIAYICRLHTVSRELPSLHCCQFVKLFPSFPSHNDTFLCFSNHEKLRSLSNCVVVEKGAGEYCLPGGHQSGSDQTQAKHENVRAPFQHSSHNNL
jgi:hypothetical protein